MIAVTLVCLVTPLCFVIYDSGHASVFGHPALCRDFMIAVPVVGLVTTSSVVICGNGHAIAFGHLLLSDFLNYCYYYFILL